MAKYASCIFWISTAVYILRIVTRARDAPRRKVRRRAEGAIFVQNFLQRCDF